MLNLWRLTWSHALGVYWLHCRAVTQETAQHWQRIYEGDDSGALYQVSAKKPAMPNNAEQLAQHVAKF